MVSLGSFSYISELVGDRLHLRGLEEQIIKGYALIHYIKQTDNLRLADRKKFKCQQKEVSAQGDQNKHHSMVWEMGYRDKEDFIQWQRQYNKLQKQQAEVLQKYQVILNYSNSIKHEDTLQLDQNFIKIYWPELSGKQDQKITKQMVFDALQIYLNKKKLILDSIKVLNRILLIQKMWKTINDIFPPSSSEKQGSIRTFDLIQSISQQNKTCYYLYCRDQAHKINDQLSQIKEYICQIGEQSNKIYIFVTKVEVNVKKLSNQIKRIHNPELTNVPIQIMTFKFIINTDDSSFMTQDFSNSKFLDSLQKSQPNSTNFKDYYFTIEMTSIRNGIVIPNLQSDLQRQKLYFTKHYSLAYQGGGAKGIAYVGGYKAIQEKIIQNNTIVQDIPIKSIIGSSAGGIIALAISTGISYKQVQKICQKMNQIPQKDSIKYPKNKNQEQIKKQFQKIKNTLIRVLKDYGIIYPGVTQTILEIVQQLLQKSQHELLGALASKKPSIAQILSMNNPNIKQKHKINLYGILVQGGLMEGKVIHDIGAECLIKYLKQIFRKNKSVLLNMFDSIGLKNKDAIKQHLQGSITSNNNLLGIKIEQLYQFSNDKIFISRVLITILNKFVILLKEYQEIDNLDQINQFFQISNFNKIFKYNRQIDTKVTANKSFIFTIQQESQTSNINEVIQKYSDLLKLVKHSNILSYSDIPNGQSNHIVLNEFYQDFIDYNLFELLYTEENKNKTVFQIVYQLFGGLHYDKVMKNQEIKSEDNKFSIDRLFTKVKENDFKGKIAEIIFETIHQAIQNQNKFPQTIKSNAAILKKVQDYSQLLRKFIQQVAKINLEEYYSMTGIELTCTSVDLDHKVLRFFNHKTTPLLPVCKAVQMTGSFPVAFKAQKWDKNWGKYYVHYPNDILQIDITGHQFTDGGLLANFPIKYLDNDQMRSRYFSHGPVQNKTIMLGFGLDFHSTPASPNIKQLVSNQISKSKQNKSQKSLMEILGITTLGEFRLGAKIVFAEAKQTTSNIIESASNSLKGFFNKIVSMIPGKNDKQQQTFSCVNDGKIQWSALCHEVINQIPVLKFALKIVQAYPNSDRNLNLQAFNSQIILQSLNNQNQEHFSQKDQQLTQLPFYQQICASEKSSMRAKLSKLNNFFGEYENQMIKFQNQHQQLKLPDAQLKWFWKFDNSKKIQNNETKQMKQHLRKISQQFTAKQKEFKTRTQIRQKQCNQFYVGSGSIRITQNDKRWTLINIMKLLLRHSKLDKSKFKIQLSQSYAKFKYPERPKMTEETFDIADNTKRIVQRIFMESNCLKAEQMDRIRNTNYQDLIKKEKEVDCFQFQAIKQIFDIFCKKIIQVFQKKELPKIISLLKLYAKRDWVKQAKVIYDSIQNTYSWNENDEFQRIVRSEEDGINQDLMYLIMQMPISEINEKLELTQIKKHILSSKDFANKIKTMAKIIYDSEHSDRKSIIPYQKRMQIQNLISNIILGSKKQNIEFVENKYKQKTEKGKISSQDKKLKPAQYIQGFIVEYIEDQIQSFLLQNNIAEISGNLTKLYKRYKRQYSFLTETTKEMMFLLIHLTKKDMNILNQPKEIMEKRIFYDNLLFKLILLMNQMEVVMGNNYNNLLNQPINALNEELIGQIFIIKMSNIQTLIKQIYLPIKIQYQRGAHNIQDEQICLSGLLVYFQKIQNCKISLPMFEHDWNLMMKSVDQPIEGSNQFYKSKLELKFKQILSSQNTKANRDKYKNDILTQFNKDYIQIQRKIYSKSTDKLVQMNTKFIKQQDSNYNILTEKFTNPKRQDFQQSYNLTLLTATSLKINNNPFNEDNLDVHLMLEGVGDSNEYFPAFYSICKQYSKLKNKGKGIQPIKAITSGNYHCIFGFHLALNQDFDVIRKQMYKIKKIALAYEDENKITEEFNEYYWFGQLSSSQSKTVLKNLEEDQLKFFDQLANLQNNEYKNRSLEVDYQAISEKAKQKSSTHISKYYRMIDQISKQVKIIDHSLKYTQKAKQLCRQIAANYNDKDEDDKFQNLNNKSFKTYKDILSKLYETFGSLVEAIVCEFISNYSNINITPENSQKIIKGIIIKKLFTIFKLRNYVMTWLKEKKLSPNISLGKFYNSAPREIFLNFTTVNANQERIEFINKTTKPNMPVWAAVVATSSLPLLYKFFEASKDWENTIESESFFSSIISDFFRQKTDQNQRITSYCSANYVSTLPLELMTNKTVTNKLQQVKNMKKIAIAFNDSSSNIGNILIDYKYFNFKQTVQLFAKTEEMSTFINICNFYSSSKRLKKTKIYKDYKQQIFEGAKSSMNLIKIFNTLSNCNDNFILKWYYDKLIRLPIRIDTLDFHQIVQGNVFQKYHLNILSEKSQETIERSYEITKFFTDYLRLDDIKNDKKQRTAEMKVEYIYKIREQNGIMDRFIKLSLINHSKWNKNRYNNFLVAYRVYDEHNSQNSFEFAFNSQLYLPIEQSSKLQIRFYYPKFDELNDDQSRIFYTNWIFNFSKIVEKYTKCALYRDIPIYYTFQFQNHSPLNLQKCQSVILSSLKERWNRFLVFSQEQKNIKQEIKSTIQILKQQQQQIKGDLTSLIEKPRGRQCLQKQQNTDHHKGNINQTISELQSLSRKITAIEEQYRNCQQYLQALNKKNDLKSKELKQQFNSEKRVSIQNQLIELDEIYQVKERLRHDLNSALINLNVERQKLKDILREQGNQKGSYENKQPFKHFEQARQLQLKKRIMEYEKLASKINQNLDKQSRKQRFQELLTQKITKKLEQLREDETKGGRQFLIQLNKLRYQSICQLKANARKSYSINIMDQLPFIEYERYSDSSEEEKFYISQKDKYQLRIDADLTKFLALKWTKP